MKFSSKYVQKNNASQFFQLKGSESSILHVFVGNSIPNTSHRELPPPSPPKAMDVINWISSPLVLVYYRLTFLNQVRFLNFWHFFFVLILLQISQASFFMILTIFDFYIHCENEKKICSKFQKSRTCFGKAKNRFFFSQNAYFFMILNIFWTFYPSLKEKRYV